MSSSQMHDLLSFSGEFLLLFLARDSAGVFACLFVAWIFYPLLSPVRVHCRYLEGQTGTPHEVVWDPGPVFQHMTLDSFLLFPHLLVACQGTLFSIAASL